MAMTNDEIREEIMEHIEFLKNAGYLQQGQYA